MYKVTTKGLALHPNYNNCQIDVIEILKEFGQVIYSTNLLFF